MSAHSQTRYLTSKKTVDDRSLNQHVVAALRSELQRAPAELRILEIGAGLGNMIARLVDWDMVKRAEYTLLDADAESLRDAPEWLKGWARESGVEVETLSDGLRLRGGARDIDITVRLRCSELRAYLAETQAGPRADLLVANAFLDLVDVEQLLPALFGLIGPRGLWWFTINFDGETIFQPDHDFDAPLMEAYHRTMDERVWFGHPAGEARCGRHLFGHLCRAGAEIAASGASDWVVHAQGDKYPADEAYFIEHILHTIETALRFDERVDQAQLEQWLATRRIQLAEGELVYLAHQLDFFGRAPQS
jgi:hypothetical protein